MKKHLPSNNNDTFQDIAVLMTGELGSKSLRSWLKKSDTNDIDSEVKDVLKEISTDYISHLIKYLNGYFINGKNPSNVDTTLPPWIELSRKAFDIFSPTEVSIGERKEAFSKLLRTLVQPDRKPDPYCRVSIQYASSKNVENYEK